MFNGNAERLQRWLFTAIVGLLIIDQTWMVLTTIGHASDDLAVVWLACTDYSKGIFHEPFFYGQDYGVMLEALCAAPFVRLGADPVVMVAILFGIFNIVPFLAFAVHHRSRGQLWAANVFVAVPLLLPVEHGLQITALNGLALLAFVPLAYRIKDPSHQGFVLALILSAAIVVNPNVALVALPLLVHHVLEHRGKYVLPALCAGAVPMIGFWWWVRIHFFSQQAGIVNTIFDWRLHFKPYMIGEALKRLDSHFAWTAPLGGTHGSIALLLMVLVCILSFKQARMSVGWALIGVLLLVIFSFCFAKVHDGSDSIFFPLSRVFLGVPFILAWAFARLQPSPATVSTATGVLALLAIANCTLRMSEAHSTYASELSRQEGLPVRTWPVSNIKERCMVVNELAEKTGAEHIIILRGEDPFASQFLAYSLPVFHPRSPMTWMVDHDRRKLQRVHLSDMPIKRALVVGADRHHLQLIRRLDDNVSVVRSNGPLSVVVNLAGMPISEVQDRLR